MNREPVVIDASTLVDKLQPKAGDILVLRLPHGLTSHEVAQTADAMQQISESSGASVVMLMPGATLEAVPDSRMDWLAREGVALLGYSSPASDGIRRPTDEIGFRVVHPAFGTLGEHPSYLEALRLAQAMLPLCKSSM